MCSSASAADWTFRGVSTSAARSPSKHFRTLRQRTARVASLQAFKSAAAPIIGVALLCTAWVEFAGLLYLRAGKKIFQRIIAICAAGIGAACLIAWGLLRGYHLKFAAGLAGNPLGDFLTNTPRSLRSSSSS